MFYQILLALRVSLDTPYDTAKNSACQLSDNGLSRNFFYQLMNIISIHFSFIFSICLHLENESL